VAPPFTATYARNDAGALQRIDHDGRVAPVGMVENVRAGNLGAQRHPILDLERFRQAGGEYVDARALIMPLAASPNCPAFWRYEGSHVEPALYRPLVGCQVGISQHIRTVADDRS